MQKSFFIITVLIVFGFNSAIGQIDPKEIAKLKYALAHANSDTSRIIIYNELAGGYRFSKIDSGLYYAELAFELSKKINYSKGKISSLDAKGFILLEAGDIPQSLNCQLSALSILENNPDTGRMASILNRIGNIYMELKEYKRAINYYRQSQVLYDKLNDKGSFYNEVSNIGNIFELMGTLDSAKIYQQRVFDFSIQNTDRNVISGEMRARFGNVESRLGNYNEALMHYRKGIIESNIDFDFRNIAFNYIQIAKLFNTLHQYDSSLYYARKTIETGKTIAFKKAIYEASDLMATLFKLKQQPDSALHYYELANAYKDSLYGPKIFQKLQLINLNEQERQQELQKENAELQNKYRMIAFLSTLFVFFLIALFLWFNNKKQKRINLKLTLQKKEIEERTFQLVEEKKKSDDLLLNILPSEMAEELKLNGTTKAKAFTMVTVMFTDFKDFTTVSEKVSAELLVDEIHHCFSAFDRIIQKYKIEKIKTIGDSYMCASGLPVSNFTHAKDMVNAAFEIRNFMLERKKEKEANDEIPFELRIGIHTGPVVAGIVGIKKFAYDIWGDTVNLAARMEQNSEAGKVNISGSTYELIKDKFTCTHRGKIQAKNKGEIDMYFAETIS